MINFRIDVYHHVEFSNGIEGKLDAILGKLDALTKEVDIVTQELDRLKQSVADVSGEVQSAVTLIGGLSAQIRALKDDPAALAALADQLDTDKQALADAIVANPQQV